MKKVISSLLVLSTIVSMICVMPSSVFAGSSTPPTYEQRLEQMRENENEEKEIVDLTENEDDYNSRTERPIVDNSKYDKPTNSNRPERPVVDLSGNDEETPGTVRPPRPVVDISGDDEPDGSRPPRPVVDVSEDEDEPEDPTPPRPIVDVSENDTDNTEITVSKDFYDVSKSHTNYEAIKALTEQNIISGDGSGYFKPDNYITRAEFVKIICEAYNITSNKSSTNFEDIRGHWAKEYIGRAYNAGIINGTSSTTFSPNNNITYEQAAKIILEVIGIGSDAELYGGYPNGYTAIAKSNNLFKNTSGYKYTDNMTKASVAQAVYNSFNISPYNYIKPKVKSTITFNVDCPDTIKKGKSYTLTGTVTSNYKITKVEARISDQDDNIIQSVVDEVYSDSYNIRNSKIDENMMFGKLKVGTYLLSVYAKDESGKSVGSVMRFVVIDNSNTTISTSHSEFIERIGNAAIKDYKTSGILPSLTIAQAILESSWGNSGLTRNANSLFGIKATSGWQGKVYSAKTKEFYTSTAEEITAKFRAYDSWEESIADHSKVLMQSRYDAVRSASNYKEACKAVHKAGYATDPDYADKLINVIECYRLYEYDKKEVSTQQNGNSQASTSPINYNGKTYTYETGNKYDPLNHKTHKIRTKSYSTGDYANIQDVWKVFYGYNPTLYDNNPLYGKLEWYCQGVGSLVVEFDLRNASDDNTKQFDIYRLKQDGSKYKLPSEYLGYNKFITDKITMTKNGNTAFIGVQCLANIFACSIDYKNAITPNANMISSLQKITDSLNSSSSTVPTTENKKDAFVKIFTRIANEQVGKDYKTYMKNPYSDAEAKSYEAWCVDFATWLAGTAMLEFGVSVSDAKNIVPYSAGTASFIKYYNKNQYHTFLSYTGRYGDKYERKCFSKDDYTPQVGDFVFIETDSSNKGPDHTEIVLEVYPDKIITIAGNTKEADLAKDKNGKVPTVSKGVITSGTHKGESAGKYRSVKKITYIFKNDRWCRDTSSGNYIYGFISPYYPY